MPNEKIIKYLRDGKIISEAENLYDLVERVFGTIDEVGLKLGSESKKDELIDLFMNDYIVPTTAMLTNAGRNQKPLAACSVPSFNKNYSRSQIEQLVNDYHSKGMGTGFNFDDSNDPVSELLFFNDIAVREVQKDIIERPVGNMGIITIDHPKIIDFINSKRNRRSIDWKFNNSINMTDEYVNSLNQGLDFKLKDGTIVNPKYLIDLISEAVYDCGDPGILFLDRFEEYNITPHLGRYFSLAPCGEIPMAQGEVCQFAYINLGKFVEDGIFNYEKLDVVTSNITEFLDNSLEYSIGKMDNESSKHIMTQKRKIGIGVCGVADAFQKLNISYDSKDALIFSEDVMSFINYVSKCKSVELAKERGTFPAFYDSETKREKILSRYLNTSTNTISAKDWDDLESKINIFGIRNVSTIALPPTGRSSYIIGASSGIEPIFRFSSSLVNNNPVYSELFELSESDLAILDKTGSFKETSLDDEIKLVYKNCLEINPNDHLNVVSAFQKYTDDSISKTINMPENIDPYDIGKIYLKAYELGLKGITVYRNGSLNQPIKLGDKK
jgi:ribonucleoside-diphosphate reductase alpha chain